MSDEAKILIVDDVPENISVLFEFLIQQGYDVSIAPDGESAIEVVEHEPPDLILLDVMMPGLDGFETCRRLKEDEWSREIPVIFMTALSDTVDKVKGFDLGAVDYVTKPVQQDEVLGRIRAHITIRRLQLELKERNQRLAEQNAELDAFAHTVAHDLRNPLGVIDNAVYLLKRDLGEGITPEIVESFGLLNRSSKRMRDIIEGLMTLAGIAHKRAVFEPLDMGNILINTLERLGRLRAERGGEIRLPEQWPQVVGHPSWVEELWTNLVSNGLKYGGAPPRLELGATPEAGRVRFWVRDQGPGLTEEQRKRLFVPFTRLHTLSGEGYGLGLSIVQRIASKLGGEAGVESAPGAGSTFYFTLPTRSPEEEA
jgi:two-component system, sensor histidine kinase and response regulator